MPKDRLFTLDREGGREKIARAMYSPQQYRHENAGSKAGRRWSALLAVLIGMILGMVLYKSI